MLDYAANAISFWTVDTIRLRYESKFGNESAEAKIEMHARFGESIEYDEFWEKAVDNNLNGLFNLTKIVTPIMKSQGGGTILVISASFSVRQNGNTAYATAKAGLIGFAQSLSKELYSDNIRVNVVAPGLIRGAEPQTPVIPGPNLLNRVGVVQDIAYAAAYLVSDEASWVNGQVLAVDGGVDVNARSLENV